MKLGLSWLFLLFSICLFSQEIRIGKYRSKEGSILEFTKNGNFKYQKSNYHIEGNLIYAWDFAYQAIGNYKEKNGFLIFNSDELKIKNNTHEKGIMLSVQEIRKTEYSFSDLISIKAHYDLDLLNLYICDTPQEGFDYLGSCVKLLKENKFEFFKGSFFLRIYPNLEAPKNRLLKQKTVYFDTERLTKKDNFSDLKINIEFDTKYFNYEFFKDEIMLIKKGKIYHEGQEFCYQE